MLTIYGVPVSVHTRKALVTAGLKGTPFENVPVSPFDPPEDWRQLSPTGLIPAISDGGFELADSSAICRYLDSASPGASIYPANPRHLARALWLEQYGGGVLFRQVVHPLFHQKIIRPHILRQGPPDEAEIGRITGEVAPGILSYLEGQVDGDYFLGEAMTIADITIASNLVNYRYLGFDVAAADYPRLAGVFRRTTAEPSFRAALAAEEPFASRMGLDRSFLD